MKRILAFSWISLLALTLSAEETCGDAQADFDALFSAEAKKVAATRIKSDDAALAAKLLAAAAGAPDSPDFQILLYEKAYEFGAKSKDGYAHAIAAARSLARADVKRADECEKKILTIYNLQYRTARGSARAAAGQVLSGYLVSLGDRHAAAGNTADALVEYRRASVVARSARLKNAKAILAKINAAVARQHLDRRIAGLRKTVEGKPDDTRTTKQLMMLLLVEKNDPKAAMELLPKADADETTRTFIPLAMKRWDDLPDDTYIDLGHWYQQLSKRTTGSAKLRILARARSYYQTYLTLRGKADASALRATMPLKQLDKQLAGAGPINCGYTPPPRGVTREMAQWTRKRDAMPVKQRLSALLKKLSEVSEGQKVNLKGYKIEADRIVELNFWGAKSLMSTGPLYGMKLRGLNLAFSQIEHVEPLAGMKLTSLDMVGCPKLQSLKGLEGMRFTKLDLYGSKMIDDLTPLRGLPLTSLGLRACSMKSLDGLEGMPLESLSLYDCQKLKNIESLAGAPLGRLNISNCWHLADFKPLRGLPLKNFNTNTLPPAQFALLRGMPLKVLWISGCKIKDLSPLRGMRLTALSLQNCKTLQSIAGIEKMPLEKLYLQGTKFATPQVAAGLKKKIPTLKTVVIK